MSDDSEKLLYVLLSSNTLCLYLRPRDHSHHTDKMTLRGLRPSMIAYEAKTSWFAMGAR